MVKIDLSDIAGMMTKLRNPKPKGPCCCSCGRSLVFDLPTAHDTQGGPMCDSCYYQALGKLIEETGGIGHGKSKGG